MTGFRNQPIPPIVRIPLLPPMDRLAVSRAIQPERFWLTFAEAIRKLTSSSYYVYVLK
jgi:hypothetical protein